MFHYSLRNFLSNCLRATFGWSWSVSAALSLLGIVTLTPHAANAQSVLSVSAGEGHTMFVKADGTLWATGLDDYGQLGDGQPGFDRLVPFQVGNGVASVSAGHHHSMWVKRDGTLWAVGRNNFGQLGYGSVTLYRTAPIQVATGVASVSAGLWHTMFIKTDGTLWGMGNNGYGQLGDGTKTDHSSPVQVATGVAAVAVGDGHTIFLKTNGTLWAVGYNQYGQLGDGTTLPAGTNQDNPVQVATGVASIAAFANQSYFVKTNGTLYAMGFNLNGQLGDKTAVGKSTPTPIDVDVVSVAAGAAHMVYVTTDGKLWATGNNGFGQLGDGSSAAANISTPELISNGVASVAAGYVHSLFVKTDGTLWGMGTNQYGPLGDGTSTITQLTPVQMTTSPVPAPPVITTQPVNQTAAVNDPFSFSVVATGVGPLTYQWYQDRLPVPFATDATFSATTALVRAGSYTVTVTNAGGIVTSNAAVLSVGSVATTFGFLSSAFTYTGAPQSPTIFSTPGGATFTVGGTLTATNPGTYTATATATGSYAGTNTSLIWTIAKAPASVALGVLGSAYTGTPKVANATTIPVGLIVNFTYNGSSTAPTNSGSYAVVATINEANYAGSTTGTLTIAKVTPVITWATPPAITVGTALSGTQLNATASVPGNFVYSPASGAILAAGAKTLGVTFTPTDTTNYTTVTASVTLTVQSPPSLPVFTTQPVSKTLTVGGSVVFAAAASGVPSPTFQWRKNGVIIPGATSSTYTIFAVGLNDAGNYSVIGTNSIGSATSNNANLTVRSSVVSDFNGDGQTDILWRNTTTGSVSSWTASGYQVFGVESGGWQVIGTGDFDGEGHADALWHNLGTGVVASWTSSAGYQVYGVEGSGWSVIGAGDFDGDGKTDVLWHYIPTGMVASWSSSAGYTTFGSEGGGWSVIGTGDFNGDGKTDLLWHSTLSGAVSAVLTNGEGLSLDTEGGGWSVIGTGDFNSDGKTDVLWHNTVTGAVTAAFTGGGGMSLGTEGGGWSVISSGDYDGDGRSDVLWHNHTTGLVASWTSSGQYKIFGVEGEGWSVFD